MTATISSTLAFATHLLTPVSNSARLDAEVLLSTLLNCSRTHLHTYPEEPILPAILIRFHQLLARRQLGEPLAYVLEQREFWSLELCVTPDTLIPRPETELIVETALNLLPKNITSTVADLGTGSGAIALALAHECPAWQIYASDRSSAALDVAKKNAQRLGFEHLTFLLGDWCAALPPIHFDAILSNPPYIAEDDPCIERGDLRFEPRSALVALEDGLRDIRVIAEQARAYLRTGGWLLLEIGYGQAVRASDVLGEAGYAQIQLRYDLAGHARVILGQFTSGS